jgi:hypothetical protein
MRTLLQALALFLVSVSSFAADSSPIVVSTGELNGAKFSIALPVAWNRHVLLIAHALRPEREPLVADLSPDDFAYKSLLNEGWIVAKTSFRRNGIIVSDGIADLDALRAHIVRSYGQPLRVLVEGESLGGLIAVLIAERDPKEPRLYDGVVAISPALHIKEIPSLIGLSLQPRIPLVFLSNQSELEAPKAYIVSPFARDSTVVEPALFRVSRGGRLNINQRERLIALRALNAWLDHGPAALPKPVATELYFDATVAPDPRPSTVTMHPGGRSLEARVIGFLPGYVLIDAQPSDFATIGIRPGTWFRLTIRGKPYRMFYGRDQASVKKNEWVAFPHAEGNFVLARNQGDAAAATKLAVGDTVALERFDPK